MRKSERARPYAPDFVGLGTLAYRLDCSDRIINHYVRCGILPPPLMIGNLIRWRWTDIEFHIDRQNGLLVVRGDGRQIAEPDEYSADIEKIKADFEKPA